MIALVPHVVCVQMLLPIVVLLAVTLSEKICGLDAVVAVTLSEKTSLLISCLVCPSPSSEIIIITAQFDYTVLVRRAWWTVDTCRGTTKNSLFVHHALIHKSHP